MNLRDLIFSNRSADPSALSVEPTLSQSFSSSQSQHSVRFNHNLENRSPLYIPSASQPFIPVSSSKDENTVGKRKIHDPLKPKRKFSTCVRDIPYVNSIPRCKNASRKRRTKEEISNLLQEYSPSVAMDNSHTVHSHFNFSCQHISNRNFRFTEYDESAFENYKWQLREIWNKLAFSNHDSEGAVEVVHMI
jgi:hypothetical protein